MEEELNLDTVGKGLVETIKQMAESQVGETLANQVKDLYLSEAQKANPHLQQVYVAVSQEKMQFLVVEDGEEGLDPIREAERKVRLQFSSLGFAFRLLSSQNLSQDQIEQFRKKWIPDGKRIFPNR